MKVHLVIDISQFPILVEIIGKGGKRKHYKLVASKNRFGIATQTIEPVFVKAVKRLEKIKRVFIR